METFDGYSKQDFDEFYHQLRAQFAGRTFNPAVMNTETTVWDKLTNLLCFLPDLYNLSVQLTFDDSCEAYKKGELYGAVKYVVYPIDMIPDAIPGAGWVDDLVVAAIALYNFIRMGEEEEVLVRNHWDGSSNPVEIVSQILDVAGDAIDYLPNKLMNRVTATLHSDSEG